jgi:hypothetical protein
MKSEIEDHPTKKQLALKIKVKNNGTLSKNQILFNKLTAKIESLENLIVQDNLTFDKLLRYYSDEIPKHLLHQANLQFQLAQTFGRVSAEYKFSKKQLSLFQVAILDLCNQAFKEFEPTQEQEEFYNKWSNTSYREELENEKAFINEELSEFLNNNFGIDVDLTGFDGSPESYMKLDEEVKKKTQQESQRPNKSARRTSRETAKKVEEVLKNKTLRSIYITLVKILHPDVVQDPVQKAEKEDLMKQVTIAYDQKDLSTLLRLEMEWIHKITEFPEHIADEKLRIYISALKERVAALELQRKTQRHHPRFMKIRQYVNLPEKYAIREIMTEQKYLKKQNRSLKMTIAQVGNINSKKEILTVLDNLYDYEEDDFPIEFFLNRY